MPSLGGMELVLLVAVLFLLFGASRLPQLAKSLGQARNEFKKGMKEADDEVAAEQNQLATAAKPEINAVSDEQLLEELRRRAEAKQVN